MQRLKKRGRLIAIILILLVLAGAAASIASEAAEYTAVSYTHLDVYKRQERMYNIRRCGYRNS